MEHNYKAFYFFRCECVEEVSKTIELAKCHGKTVYFDIDDLITDRKFVELVPFVHDLPPLNRKLFERHCMQIGETLEKCDIAVATTEGLAEELGKIASRTYINRNVASKEMVDCAEKAYQISLAQKQSKAQKAKIRLGYFSGSLTHNADFEIIRPALIRLMEEFPQIELLLVGELEEADELKRFANRIVKLQSTDWRTLPNLIVQADINLAPIEDTLFTRAKSEIKWIEAALVRVPTAASNVGAFAEMIEDGVTGILCDNMTQEWYEKLRKLIIDERYRKDLAEHAYQYVIQNCTTEAQAERFGAFIRDTANLDCK